MSCRSSLWGNFKVTHGNRGVIVTAKGEKVDFVSRFFTPQMGIPENRVSGTAHTTLTAFWSPRLGKKELKAVQLSARRGYIECRELGKRTEISGRAKTFLVGQIYI
jgi:predicted PhzF superfamily epimerase YddE/YHI9